MLKLRFSPTSPYVRKVMVTALELGLEDRIEKIMTNVWAPDTDIADNNPLGKVPCLTTEEGMDLFDSPIICEYLDSLAGGKLFPQAEDQKWHVLRLMALGDGIIDAGVNCRIEDFLRPEEKRYPKWRERQTTVILRSVADLEKNPNFADQALHSGHIAIACGLDYANYRLPDLDWRQDHPKVVSWFESFVAKPSMQATAPPQDS